MGFNKSEVTDFLNQTESEMEVYESRQAAADKTIASMKNEIQNLTRRLEILMDENCNLENSNAELRKNACNYDMNPISAEEHRKVLAENIELKSQLEYLEKKDAENPEAEKRQLLLNENEELKQENAALKEELESVKADYQVIRTECDTLRANVYSSEKELKSIQDALVSAQRMSEIVIGEAKSEAERLTAQAQKDAEILTLEAKQSATQTLEEAQQRNLDLQQSYDRMLIDTCKMKSELIELYRRHLALLAEIPGNEEVPILEEKVLGPANGCFQI